MYDVIEAETLSGLKDQVIEAISKGWIPQGGVHVMRDQGRTVVHPEYIPYYIYHQAMSRGE